jgi:hypothetical protein
LNGLEEVKIAEEIALPSLTPVPERPKVKIMEQKPNLLAV